MEKENNTIDFLLTKKRDKKAAKRFFIKAIENNGLPGKITIDKSGSNKAAIKEYNAENDTTIEIRQVKYLNNIVEQVTTIAVSSGSQGPCLDLKSFIQQA